MSTTMHDRQHGMSIIELMIAMALGLLILLGLTSLFVQTKQSFKQDDLVARMQEDSRFAVSELRHDVAMSGFWGPLLDPDIVVNNGTIAGYSGNTAALFVYPTAITVDDGAVAADTILGQTLASVVPGTDAVGIVKVEGVAAVTVSTNTDTAVAAGQTALAVSQQYLQTNGVLGRMLLGSDAPTTVAGSAVPVAFSYWRYKPVIYWVRSYALTAGDGIPTLVRLSLDDSGATTTEEIAQGVEDLQIEYGIDTTADGYADRYIADPSAAQMKNVISVRIYLLARSTEADSNYTNSRTYTLSNSSVAPDNPGDHYYRRVFATTVQVRNNAHLLTLGL